MSQLGQLSIVIIAVSTILSLFVTWSCVCTINAMSRRTRFLVRLAYILLGTGAIGIAMYPVWFHEPVDGYVLILLVAIALIAFDKWRLQRKPLARHHRIL